MVIFALMKFQDIIPRPGILINKLQYFPGFPGLYVTWDTLTMFVAVGGREFEPRPGQYSRMSFSSDQVTGTVFSHLKMPFLPNSESI